MHPTSGRRTGRAIVAVAACAAIFTACDGRNLFQGFVGAGGGGPQVQISAPTEGFNIAQGAQITVRAEISAANGIAVVEYSGVLSEDGSLAFVGETEDYPNPPFATVTNTLNPSPTQGTGEALIIVRATDALGEVKADTVRIEIS